MQFFILTAHKLISSSTTPNNIGPRSISPPAFAPAGNTQLYAEGGSNTMLKKKASLDLAWRINKYSE